MDCLFSPVPIARCGEQIAQTGEAWQTPLLVPLALAVVLMALSLVALRR